MLFQSNVNFDDTFDKDEDTVIILAVTNTELATNVFAKTLKTTDLIADKFVANEEFTLLQTELAQAFLMN